MIFKRLTIKNFGKIHDKTLEFSQGINILYGENESGKSTVHTFVRSMLYGITRQRGRASRNDIYTRYEPWENPAQYGGSLWFSTGGEDYRLTRNFYKENQNGELLNLCTGELTGVEDGQMEQLLGGVSQAVYDNTVSVAQLKSVTGKDLASEVQNYMASYQGTGDSSVDLGRTMQMLKMSRKGYQVQKDKKRKEAEKEQEKLNAKIMKGITSKKVSLKNKEQNKTILTMDFTDFPYLAIWSKPNAPFICIEPWYSTADNVKSSGVFTQKQDLIVLKPKQTFECKYTVEFF